MKTVRQGNDILLTVPAKFGIPENVEYMASKGRNDSITFIKQSTNIFKDAVRRGEVLDAAPGFPEDEPIGREMI